MVTIGITLGYDQHENYLHLKDYYLHAIKKAGGIPVLIPPLLNEKDLDSIISSLDGVLLSGGGDVDPYYFDEEPQPALGRIDPLRDKLELKLTHKALQSNLAVFGICKGMQIMNIVYQGKVTQDLGDDGIKHSQNAPKWYPTHYIELINKRDNPLLRITDNSYLRVNSFHHQGIKKKDLGERLCIAALSSDQVIEALYDPEQEFFVGVQWHPERMKEESQHKLFKLFVESARHN